MAIDPVKIPQNVYIEDRIVGPLTLRQIIIMTFGAGFSYLLYSTVQKATGTMNIPLTILLWSPAAVAAAFAMISVNDLSLLRICMLILERTQKPGTRTFAARQGISIVFRTSGTIKDEPKKVVDTKPVVNTDEQIRSLSAVIDAGGTVGTKAEPARDAATQDIVEPKHEVRDEAPLPPLPVDRTAVTADAGSATKPVLSDLSLFRDVFPPETKWQ